MNDSHSRSAFVVDLSSQLFRPLLATLRFQGLLLKPRTKRNQVGTGNLSYVQRSWKEILHQMTVSNFVLLVLCHLFMLHLISVTCYVMTTTKLKLVKISSHLSVLLRMLVTVVSVDYFFLKQGNIFNLLDIINRTSPYRHNQIESIRRRCWLLTGSGWLYILIILPIGALTETSQVEDYFSRFFYNYNVSYISVQAARTICCVDWILFTYLDTLPAFLIYLYIGSCLCLQAKVVNLVELVQSGFHSSDEKRSLLYRIQVSYTTIYSHVKKLDEVYMRIVFVWFADLVHRFLYYIPSAVFAVRSGNLLEHASFAVNAIYYGFLFVFLAVGASGIVDKLEDCEVYLQEAVTEACCPPGFHRTEISSGTLQQANTLVHLLSTSRIGLTGWNCFVIRRGLVLTVFGGILTYIVLVIQGASS